jgi:hypothetical protein
MRISSWGHVRVMLVVLRLFVFFYASGIVLISSLADDG